MAGLITGIGVVSPYGAGRERFWQGVSRGEQALRPVTRFDASPYRNVLGGEVPDFDPGSLPRAAAYAVAAAREALADAGVEPKTAGAPAVGLVLGTNFGPMQPAEEAFRRRASGGGPRQDLRAYLPGGVLEHVVEQTGASGPRALLSLSCASGAAALAVALEWLEQGRVGAVLAGGFDELSETAFAGLSALRAISKDTIRPFDRNRGGTIFSEGAAVLLLESEQRALERGARVYARLLGRGLNNEAFHMTAPDKSGRGIAALMRAALGHAGVQPGAIVHINCHGTGTRYNDLIETTAIRSVFREHAGEIVLTANKSLFGHAMGAAGALEAAVTCLSIHHGLVPPTIGCREPDPELEVRVCRDRPLRLEIPLALCNSYGLGGTNACLVLGAA